MGSDRTAASHSSCDSLVVDQVTSYHSVSLLYVLSQSTLTARLVLSLSALGNARVSAGHRGSITLTACTALTHCHRRGPSARALLRAPCACARWKGGCWAQARCSSSHPPPVVRVETNYSTLRRPSPALVVQPGLHRGWSWCRTGYLPAAPFHPCRVSTTRIHGTARQSHSNHAPFLPSPDLESQLYI